MKLFRNNAEALAEKAMEHDSPPRPSTPPPTPREVYPGNMPLTRSVDIPTPMVPGSRNRKIVRRRTSPFSIILLLLGAAVAIVLYISNIIAVNQLLNEVNALQTQYEQITMRQEALRAQINRMASLERIQEKARELDLKNPSKSPVWLQIDEQKVKDLEEARKEASE
jgi:cell division protein FtsB